MQPNKFDQSIKDKVDLHEVKPSNQAWNRLEYLLDEKVEVSKSTSKIYYKYAAVVCFLCLGFFAFWSLNTNVDVEPTVVETKQILKSKDSSVAKHKERIEVKVDIHASEVVAHINNNPKSIAEIKKPIPKAVNKSADKVIIKKEVVEDNYVVVNSATINQANETKFMKEVALDAEVDSLFQIAMESIKRDDDDKLIDLNEEELNLLATALLGDVESDLEQSFRQRMFLKIKERIKNTATAQAEKFGVISHKK